MQRAFYRAGAEEVAQSCHTCIAFPDRAQKKRLPVREALYRIDKKLISLLITTIASATAVSTTATRTVVAETTTTIGGLFRACFIDHQLFAFYFTTVQTLHCLSAFLLIRHLDKTKTT